MNKEKPDIQKNEELNNDWENRPPLPPEERLNNVPLEPGKEEKIAEVRERLDKTFKPEPFNELLVLQKLKEASDIIYDMDALPLSVDSTYQVLSEWLTTQCEEAVSSFFKKARDGNAEERFRYSAALMRLGMVADEKVFDAALKQNLTNRHAIEELYKKSREKNKLPDERKLTTRELLKNTGKIWLEGIKSIFRKK